MSRRFALTLLGYLNSWLALTAVLPWTGAAVESSVLQLTSQWPHGHVLATLSAIVLALCEGRTGLAISGVFGAGKTRSAAALLAGLLVFDPSLQLMVLTKENIAAHAVAEHLVSLQMPDHIQWGDW